MSDAALVDRLKRYPMDGIAAWDSFWFTPRKPHLLAVLRIIAGAMLLYSHLVLAADLDSFVGTSAWINNDVAAEIHNGTLSGPDAGRSYLWHLESSSAIHLHHFFTMAVTFLFMIGLGTRIVAPLAWFLQLMLIHRLTGHLFGLDQIVTYVTMYVMLAPTGSVLSIDAILRRRMMTEESSSGRLNWLLPDARPSTAANVATRLLQIHLCVIYLFGGLAKARGVSWWDGTAVWYAIGNYEYQSFDMTWMAAWPRLFSALSHGAMFWEIFYVVLIWPRWTRPITLAMAVAVHAGIALFLGMITFGVMMIAANIIFLPPSWLPVSWRDDDQDPDSKSNEQSSDEQTPNADQPPTDDSLAEEKLNQRQRELDEGLETFQKRKEKLRSKEILFKERVERLKRREAKLKDLAERHKRRKEEMGDSSLSNDSSLGNESSLNLESGIGIELDLDEESGLNLENND